MFGSYALLVGYATKALSFSLKMRLAEKALRPDGPTARRPDGPTARRPDGRTDGQTHPPIVGYPIHGVYFMNILKVGFSVEKY